MLTITPPDLTSLLTGLRQWRTQLRPRITQTVQTTADEAVDWARTQRLSGPRPQVLQARTGQLRSSFRATVQQRGATTEAHVGFLAPEAPFWAIVHEEGRMGANAIRPRHARFLTIPLGGTTGRARDYSSTFVRGRVIYQRTAGGDRPLFLLVGQVEIPPRPVVGPTFTRYAPLLLQRLAEMLRTS
jgi:hypothetical protein